MKKIKNYPVVSINILTYNGQQYIRACLDSVLGQTYPKIEILIIDNASTDETIEILKSKILNLKSKVKVIFNKKNLGFAAGHNQGIKESRGEFVCCLNQDVVLEKDFIEKIIEVFQRDKQVAAVQGKLLRGLTSHLIDTTGLVILKNRRIIARGQGEVDRGQYEQLEEIFGVDGAGPVYRRTALEDVALSKDSPLRTVPRGLSLKSPEYFDEDFFCYKEDVDLAWRLQWAGWKSIYQPKAMAWHDRTSGESASKNPLGIIRERRKIGQFSKYLSFKNQRLLQIKNEDAWLFLKHLPWILPKEIAAWLYVLFFEKYTWPAIIQLIREIPDAWRKRKVIMGRRRIGREQMKRWFE